MRTAIYIDGFNLYYGAVRHTKYKWLNPKLLCQNILQPQHNIVSIVFCTARVKSTLENLDSPTRQSTCIKALTSYIPELNAVYGHFSENKQKCRPVDQEYGAWIEVFRMEEKGSDVNLAVRLVSAAYKDEFDCAVVVSNDSDLADAMRVAKYDCQKLIGLFTPWRRPASKQLMRYCNFQRTIRKSTLAKSQLPNPIPNTGIYKPTGR